MYGMKKTTVYLPDELAHRLKTAAASTGRSEAELIREGVAAVVDAHPSPPRLPLFRLGEGTVAARVDEILAEGFGQD